MKEVEILRNEGKTCAEIVRITGIPKSSVLRIFRSMDDIRNKKSVVSKWDFSQDNLAVNG